MCAVKAIVNRKELLYAEWPKALSYSMTTLKGVIDGRSKDQEPQFQTVEAEPFAFV